MTASIDPAALTKTPIMKRPMQDGHIKIDSVSVKFTARGMSRTAVKATSVDILPGEFVCLLGPSGCGKSTLLNCVAGFVTPSEGTVLVDGEEIKNPGPDRGMVFQQHSLYPWKTVRENIAFGPRITGRGGDKPISLANTFLEMIGLAKYANSYPSELSGGMQQRVGIARALANYPKVLLMDEPFGALDSQTRAMMQENLLRLWQEFGITVLFVTHDVDEAVYLSDRILVMSAGPGEIIEDVRVPLPRPRTGEQTMSEEFNEVRRHCLEIIRKESIKAFEQQNA